MTLIEILFRGSVVLLLFTIGNMLADASGDGVARGIVWLLTIVAIGTLGFALKHLQGGPATPQDETTDR